MLGMLYKVFSVFTLAGPASRPRPAGKFPQFATSPLDAWGKRCQALGKYQFTGKLRLLADRGEAMNCGNCGVAKPEEARFCGRCGSQLTYAGPDPVASPQDAPAYLPPPQGALPEVPAYPRPRRRRRAMTAVTAAAVAVVVIGALAVTGWREHWPPAVFGQPGRAEP